MKTKFFSSLIGMVLLIISANAQTIQQRTEKADLVIEGKVIQTKSYWNDERTQIFTSNLIDVYKVFKGELQGEQIELITKGGVTEDAFLIVTHSLSLKPQMEGIFFCDKSELPQKQLLSTPYQIQTGANAFIQYYFDANNPTATDRFQTYSIVTEDIYKPIELASKEATRIIQPNSKEQKYLNALGDFSSFSEFDSDIVIEFTFENPQLNSLTQIEFDIYAKVNSIGNGVGFGEAEVFLQYNSETFGNNIVSNGMVQTTKGAIIQNSIYQLNTVDDDTQTMKIHAEGGCENPLNAFTLTTTGQQLFHVRLTLQDISQLANIAFEDFQMSSRSYYIPSKGGSCLPFDSILVDDPLNHVRSNDPIGLNYAFDNFEVTGMGTSTASLEFDIMAWAEEEGTDFAEGFIHVDYNVLAFNSFIHDAGDLILQTGAFNQNLNYNVTAADNDFETFVIRIEAKDLNQLNEMPTSPIQMVHVRMIGDNCNESAELTFDSIAMQPIQLHHTGGAVLEMYEPVVANDSYNQAACSNSNPIIREMSPHPLCFRAGTEEILTIKGYNFGNHGEIMFRDADKENEVYATALSVDTLVWRDTMVQIYVPSVTLDGGPAGSGKVILKNETDISTTSDDALDIKYAIINKIFDLNDEPYRSSLIGQDTSLGYTFFIDSVLASKPNAIQCIEKAMMDWSCETGVTWEIGGLTSINQAALDNLNIIFWNEDGMGDSLAITYLSGEKITNCGDGAGEIFFYAQDIDIGVNGLQSWHWDCNSNTVPTGFYDFYSVMLHEFGHAHMIDHVLPSTKVMFPIAKLGKRAEFHEEDINGGLDVMAYGEDHLVGGDCPPANDTNMPDDCTNAIWEIDNSTQYRIKIYPNPLQNYLILETEFEEVLPLSVEIFDLLGHSVFSQNLGKSHLGIQFYELDISDSPIPNGLYLIRVQAGQDTFIKKITKF